MRDGAHASAVTSALAGGTDFGREMAAAGHSESLAEALRERLSRTSRAEAWRYQVAMGFLGFVAGLVLVIPVVLYSAASRNGATAWLGTPTGLKEASRSDAAHPSLVQVPTLMGRELAQPVAAFQTVPSAAGEATQDSAPHVAMPAHPPAAEQLEEARRLIRSGEIMAARALLSQSHLAGLGEAHFMLAETYDPNVLAALGSNGVEAETATARQHYEAALANGVTTAAMRLEALE
ncbi:MAG: hypothetical protein AB7O57_20005 [Hyphomicrobiaceae bacterium]